jgi:trehalose 6-phosphate phosphatase
MKYFLTAWNSLKKTLNNKKIVLFLDYDGTLAPLAETPARALMTLKTKKLLKKLSRLSRCRLAIISGRSLKDLKKMVGIDGITYVGNHGLEMEGPGIKFGCPVTRSHKATLRHIKNELKAKLSSFIGVFVEDKGLTLSIHYRRVDKKQLRRLKKLFHEIIFPYTIRDKIRISRGKKVFEIRPPIAWDKGRVALWLLNRWKLSLKDKKIVSFYIGDDITDEDAFEALGDAGIAIFVGKPKKSYAKYYLRDTEEVKKFISDIADVATKDSSDGRTETRKRAI